ncbi:MAG: 3-phosphoshikimate 1-carboxyvinyltransferase [Rhodospirillales bacterium]|nr:3-phosphoshikimate 1-carboxyvinyltransferase [Rhodospirillales bacterium]
MNSPHASGSDRSLSAMPCETLAGTLRVPGDKSVSHRSLIFGALAVGETVVDGLLEGEDVLATTSAMRAYGAEIVKDQDGLWRIHGCGVGGLGEPDRMLDMGNAGTGVRLVMGVAAGHAFTSFFCGDASLSKRPMGRVMDPLRKMGAAFHARGDGRLPLAVSGSAGLIPVEYRLPMPSAQVKSAVLLAGLHAPGVTTVIETEATRDHTERMLRGFGATVDVVEAGNGERAISLAGHQELRPATIRVPGDPSSAAFPVVAAACLPSAAIRVEGVGTNPLRTGLFQTLREMGAELRFENEREEGGEPVADLVVEGRDLRGVEVPPERAPTMIDEYPVLAVAAACAEGQTIMRGLAELRVKESDRLAAVASGLADNGVAVEELDDGLIVNGCAGRPAGGGTVAARLDHRIAMAFLVMGLLSAKGVMIDDVSPIETSFPGFTDLMAGLGAEFAQ